MDGGGGGHYNIADRHALFQKSAKVLHTRRDPSRGTFVIRIQGHDFLAGDEAPGLAPGEMAAPLPGVPLGPLSMR